MFYVKSYIKQFLSTRRPLPSRRHRLKRSVVLPANKETLVALTETNQKGQGGNLNDRVYVYGSFKIFIEF